MDGDRDQVELPPRAVYADLLQRTGGRAQTTSSSGTGDPNRCLGVVFSCDEVGDPAHAFFGPVVDGIRARSLERNADIFICFPQRGSMAGVGKEAIDRCLRRGVDGIVVLGLVDGRDDAFVSRAARLPSIFLECDPVGRGSRFVGIDNVAAMRRVVRHLASLGHRRIAHIAGLDACRAGAERLRGYELEMEALDLPILPGYVQKGDFYAISGHDGMARLLALPEPPEAVAASSDMQAIGALVALGEAGLSCPGDVALTGFDDSDYTADVQPPLTTVNQRPVQLGADAVDALIELIVYPSATQTILLEGDLVVRESCGARLLVPR
jgi:DNA-binding LacI/PurR family transcriptional regulator